MQAPKRKTSKSRRNMRRSHHRATSAQSTACSACGETIRPHTICPACGAYRGRNYFQTSAA